MQLSRPKLRVLTGTLTGHCKLRAYLCRMSFEADLTYRDCRTDSETIKHILDCPEVAAVEGPTDAKFQKHPRVCPSRVYTQICLRLIGQN